MSHPYPRSLTQTTREVDDNGIFKGLPDLPHQKELCGYQSPQPSTDPRQQVLEAELKKHIGQQIRVELTDGRVYIGHFYAYDSEGNILINASNKILPDGSTIPSGCALAPIKHLVSVKTRPMPLRR